MSFETNSSFPSELNFSHYLDTAFNNFLDGDRLDKNFSNHGAARNQLTSREVGRLSEWLRSTLQDWGYNNFPELQTGSPDGGLGKRPSQEGSESTTKKADLTIYNFGIDALTNPTAGDTLNLFVEIKNEGNESASDSITGLYLSTDNQLDAGDKLLGQANTQSIRDRRKGKVDFSVTLDEGLTGGTYYLLANADEANDIEESNENNNLGVYQIQIDGLVSEPSPPPPVYPDVVGKTLGIEPFTEGDSVLSFTYEISNIGDDDAAGSTAQFYLSTDNTLDENDLSLGSSNIDAIAAGGNQSGTLSANLTETLLAGNYTLFMQVDSSNVLDESNEGNNLFGASFSVAAPPPPPQDNWFTQNLQDSGLIILGSELGSDNHLSRQDMMQLFGAVQDNDVIDALEFNDLSQILASGKTLFGMEDHVFNLSDKLLNGDQANIASGIGNLTAGSSAATMDSLIGKWFLGTDRPDTGYSYTYTEGSLVVDSFSVDDVVQGNIGNCYFLTSLSSMAVNKPDLLKDMFIDNGDGTFTVKFYNQADEAEYVTVDRYLPTINGRLAYASQGATASDTSNELWVALAEKAYAQLAESGWSRPSVYTTAYNTNSYAAIDTGWMNEAIDVLTNLTTYTYTLHPDAALTEAILVDLVETDRLLTVGFTDGKGLVVDNHAYSINSFNATTREFHLDNSWGFSDASLTWSELASLGARLQYTNA